MNLVNKSPEITEAEIEQIYSEICNEVPYFCNLSSHQILQFIQTELTKYKNSLNDKTLNELIEIMKLSLQLEKK
jgi:hypothetical protein